MAELAERGVHRCRRASHIVGGEQVEQRTAQERAKIVADHAADHDPTREAAWIAEVAGFRAGCILCVSSKEPTAAQLRILLVDPAFRGRGVGRLLVQQCVDFARQAGYERIDLWTNDVLVAARRIYEAAGFTLVEEEKHHSFGHDLVGQTWSLDLR